jgi:hypothetical protein
VALNADHSFVPDIPRDQSFEMSNIMKIRPAEADMSHADGRADRHDEAYSRFAKFFERAQKEYIESQYSFIFSKAIGCATLNDSVALEVFSFE